ncbi:MAG: hypothetical protein HYU43_04450 [Armatimonadetes bacterium]|nr:hypothetical protein [Armatimonadota bacterium]
MGRNLDYFDHGVGEYASILVHYRPEGKIPFVTVTWAGIVNGWTLLSLKGIVVSNNTAFGARKESLEGISTCFLLRYVAERAGSLDEGIALVRQAKRACGTNMLIAAGRPPGGAILEFDSERVMVRRPTRGFVGAANSFLSLYDKDVEGEVFHGGRLGCVQNLVDGRRGRLGLSDNLAGAEGVPITTMNLHSAMIDATNLRITVAMGRIPAYRLPYRAFRLTERRLVAEEEVDSADGKAAEGE